MLCYITCVMLCHVITCVMLCDLFIYLCLKAAKRNETKDKWLLEFTSTGAFVGSVF